MKIFNVPILIFSVFLAGLTAYSQQFDCAETLNHKPYFANEHENWDQDSINRDTEILAECGKLDTVDCEIFKGPVLGVIVISEMNRANNYNEITFQTCLDFISVFKTKHKTEYDQLYKATAVRLKIEILPVKLEEFETMRPKLAATGMKNEQIDALKAFLNKNKKDWTYKEAVKAFYDSEKSSVKSGKSLEFPDLETLDIALKEAKNANKNCLIYFSGWACVNARKFETQLLTDESTQEKIRTNFIYKIAYVDDRMKVQDGNGTIGDAYVKLQLEKFKSNSQPSLYILSPDGKIIAEWSYEKGPEAFQKFLDQGISK